MSHGLLVAREAPAAGLRGMSDAPFVHRRRELLIKRRGDLNGLVKTLSLRENETLPMGLSCSRETTRVWWRGGCNDVEQAIYAEGTIRLL